MSAPTTAVKPPNPDVVAQLAHIFAGGYIVLAAAHFLPHWAGYAIATVIAAAKEYSESKGWAFWEGKQPWLSSAEDFAFFLVGIATTYPIFKYSIR